MLSLCNLINFNSHAAKNGLFLRKQIALKAPLAHRFQPLTIRSESWANSPQCSLFTPLFVDSEFSGDRTLLL